MQPHDLGRTAAVTTRVEAGRRGDDRVDRLRERLYPEIRAGGFSRGHHRTLFMLRVNALLEPTMVVLDFGAGRGQALTTRNAFLQGLFNIRSRCRRVVGVDISPEVLENPALDEAHVIASDGPLPFTSGSFDLVMAYAVFEHVDEPQLVARELRRVLRPGGWLCAWTPNRWAYYALVARLLPARSHVPILQLVSPMRKIEDIFPTHYLMNSRRQRQRYFPRDEWDDFSFGFSGDVTYHGGSMLLAKLWQLWGRVAPEFFCQAWYIFMRRR